MIRLDQAAGARGAGKKAELLARARAVGLPVPDGIVLDPDEEIDPGAIAVELARLAPAGARFAVRSSADAEDLPGASAAGVFLSLTGVAAEAVPAAIDRVRASADGEPARAYLGSRGAGAARVSVLVQPMVEARALGVLHVGEAGPIEAPIEAEERAPDQPEWGEVQARTVEPGEELARGAARMAALAGGAADVEYALTDGGVRFLQARPPSSLRAPARGIPWPVPDDGVWRRDAEHNPDPLSNAQASLVERCAGLPGASPQVVLNGFLFVRQGGGLPPSRIVPPPEVPRAFAEALAAADALLLPLEAFAPPSGPPLDRALAAFSAIVARHVGEIAPSIARARAQLGDLLARELGEPLEAHAALLGATGLATVERDQALWRLGRADPAERPGLIEGYAARFGFYAPAWDVAAPCDDELPTRLMQLAALVGRAPSSPESRHARAEAHAAEAQGAVLARLDRSARDGLRALLPVVRAAHAVAEADDALYFRAQRIVRRALLALGRRAFEQGGLSDAEAIVELPVERAEEPDDNSAVVAGALRRERRALWPPSEIRAGRPTFRGLAAGGVLRGAGAGGRGYGRAYVLRDPLASPAALPPGAVLVVPAILPSLGALLPGAAGLVTDHGGALSHGATLAREYGVPAVLGTGGATRALSDGEDLIVDGDAGRVYRVGAPI